MQLVIASVLGASVLVLLAGVFYAAMVVSGKQDDTWPDEMDKNGGTL